MISFKLFLEKRSHADQNPKISVVDALEKYKDDPDVYVHFSKRDTMLEINLKAEQGTPLGIYVYPLKEIFDEFVNMDRTNLKEFGTSKRYVWVLRSKNNKKFIKDLHKEYKQKNLNRDFRILKKKYGDELLKKGSKFDIEEEKKNLKKHNREAVPPKLFFAYMYTITNTLKGDKSYPALWNKMLVKDLGYTGIVDKSGKGYIHEFEKLQGVFLTTNAYTVLDVVENKSYETREIKTFDDLVKNSANISTPRLIKSAGENNDDYFWVNGSEHIRGELGSGISSFKIKRKILGDLNTLSDRIRSRSIELRNKGKK